MTDAIEAVPAIEPILADTQKLSILGNTVEVSIADLYRENNVRTAATLQLPGMIASIKRHGFKPNHPLVLSAKHDGRYLVLCGNRRQEAIEAIMANEPESFASLFPLGTVPCVVYTNLTAEQEALIRIDHGTDEDRVPLDEFGEFLAICQLVRAGYDTQAGIAEKMGWFKTNKKTSKNEPNRSKVQQRVNLAQLPQFVQDEYRKYCETGIASTNFRISQVAGLYKVFNEEYRLYPQGTGPLFTAKWAECLAAKDTASDVPVAQPLTPSEMEKRSKVVGSAILREALMVCGGIAVGVNLSDIDGKMVQAEAAVATLAEIADYLGESDFAELLAESVAHAADKAKQLMLVSASVA